MPEVVRVLPAVGNAETSPATVVVGEIFSMSADLYVRICFAPLELPVEVELVLLGAPYFF